jgi:hypothetical protein
MTLLVVMALFWGNCFSCPQILLNLKAHNTAHECCKRNHKPVSKGCGTQGLQHFLSSDSAAQQQTMPLAEAVVPAPVLHEIPQSVVVGASIPLYSPPDLVSLHSTFRI